MKARPLKDVQPFGMPTPARASPTQTRSCDLDAQLSSALTEAHSMRQADTLKHADTASRVVHLLSSIDTFRFACCVPFSHTVTGGACLAAYAPALVPKTSTLMRVIVILCVKHASAFQATLSTSETAAKQAFGREVTNVRLLCQRQCHGLSSAEPTKLRSAPSCCTCPRISCHKRGSRCRTCTAGA